MTPDAFRELALGLPGAVEGAHQGHPDFRVGGKIFATLGYPGSDFGVVMLTPEDQDHFVRTHPATFAPVKGAWGARGSTAVALADADQPVVAAALDAAWRRRAPRRLTKEYDGP